VDDESVKLRRSLNTISTKFGIAKVFTRCNICDADDYTLLTTGTEHEYDNTTSDVFHVVQCNCCGLTYLNPRPDVSELPLIYPANYYSYNQKKLRDEANPQSVLHKLRYKGFEAKISKSLALCNWSDDACSVLDVGCGDGHTLDLYAGHTGVKTYGVDFNLTALELAGRNGHTVYAGAFEEAVLPTDFFDLVTATHVIEHVSNPRDFLAKTYSVLRAEGILWLETPNIGSTDAHWFQNKHWGAYHFPRHWFFFSQKTLIKLAASVGFEPVFVDFVPNAIFWFWTIHSILLEKFPQSRKLADVLLPPIDFQRDSFANFIRICFFCAIDVAIKWMTGETSNMIVAFKKTKTTGAM
jgi:2-polyprenyl-3-methyl-5-hydroxy-6-metoxy-1,4-benzoquinol methylase